MVRLENEQIDLSIFEQANKTFDPHNRAKQAMREIEAIRNNQASEHKAKIFATKKMAKTGLQALSKTLKLSKENQALLLKYAGYMTERLKKHKTSISAFEKNLSESWNYCLWLKEKPANKVSQKDIDDWWQFVWKRYTEGSISAATLMKYYNCNVAFYKFLDNVSPREKGHPFFNKLEFPDKEKRVHDNQIPTQAQIKQLVEAMYVEGKKSSVRDVAIVSLCNDVGCRVGEALSIRNKDVKPEQNYLVVHLPISKSMPRTVIALASKKHLENWARISPNKNKGGEAPFFCRPDGGVVHYSVLRKRFLKALSKAGIPWRKGKNLHYLRGLFSSRAKHWGYAEKHYWLGWAFKDHEASYTELTYRDCIESYLQMLRAENNPFLKEGALLWENEQDQKKRELTDWLLAQQNDRLFMEKLAEVFVSTGKYAEAKKITG